MKLNHKYSSDVLIPYAALDDNIDLILSSKGECVTSDRVECLVSVANIVNALSVEARDMIKDMYGLTQIEYLDAWYERCGNHFNSLELLQLKLIKK